MSYHAKGELTLTNQNGKVYSYKVEVFGNHMSLTGEEGQCHYISEKPPVLVERLKREIKLLAEEITTKEKSIDSILVSQANI